MLEALFAIYFLGCFICIIFGVVRAVEYEEYVFLLIAPAWPIFYVVWVVKLAMNMVRTL